jgi:3-dehydroquinate synthetase
MVEGAGGWGQAVWFNNFRQQALGINPQSWNFIIGSMDYTEFYDAKVGQGLSFQERTSRRPLDASKMTGAMISNDIQIELEAEAGYTSAIRKAQYALNGAAAGLMMDSALSKGLPGLAAGDAAALTIAVVESCKLKAAVVAADEREESAEGGRALLNLGHTFGHALEAEARFDGSVLHGEAVAVGLGLAASLSARLGHCSQEWPSRVIAHLAACGLPARITDLPRRFTVDALVGRMAKDKKNRDGKMRFVLLRGPGDCFTSSDVPAELVEKLLRDEGAG